MPLDQNRRSGFNNLGRRFFWIRRQTVKYERIDWSDLEALYCDQGLNCWQIGLMKGVTNTTVWKALKRRGIAIRSMAESVRRGKDCPHYKHGLSGYGYPSVRAGAQKSVLLHRRVAEQILGRKLTRVEVVHHCNGIRHDSRPENLWVFPNKGAHTKYHHTQLIHPETIFLSELLNSKKGAAYVSD